MTSCGSLANTSSAATPAPDCRSARFPFPAPALALSASDNGRSTAIVRGQLVAVALLGNGKHWEPITLSGHALVRLVNPAQAATVGTQLAELCAVAKGTSKLSSAN